MWFGGLGGLWISQCFRRMFVMFLLPTFLRGGQICHCLLAGSSLLCGTTASTGRVAETWNELKHVEILSLKLDATSTVGLSRSLSVIVTSSHRHIVTSSHHHIITALCHCTLLQKMVPVESLGDRGSSSDMLLWYELWVFSRGIMPIWHGAYWFLLSPQDCSTTSKHNMGNCGSKRQTQANTRAARRALCENEVMTFGQIWMCRNRFWTQTIQRTLLVMSRKL